jgi:hypothetical protein
MSNEIEYPVYTAKMLLHTASTILKVVGNSYGESFVQDATEQVDLALSSLEQIQTDAVTLCIQEINNIDKEDIDWDNLPVDDSPNWLEAIKFLQLLPSMLFGKS